jgi:hypothetical protein
VRKLFNLKPAPEFLEWLQEMEIFQGSEPALMDGGARKRLEQSLETMLGHRRRIALQ